MTRIIVGGLLICGPFLVTVIAWIKLYRRRKEAWPRVITLLTLIFTTSIAAFAARTFVYYNLHPNNLPPWRDPGTLDIGMLFLLAPIGLIFTFIAEKRGAPRWLVFLLAIALIPLLLDGILVGSTV